MKHQYLFTIGKWTSWWRSIQLHVRSRRMTLEHAQMKERRNQMMKVKHYAINTKPKRCHDE